MIAFATIVFGTLDFRPDPNSAKKGVTRAADDALFLIR